jgi:hypothetical protein
MRSQKQADKPKCLVAGGVMLCVLCLLSGGLFGLFGSALDPLCGLCRNICIFTIDRDPEDIACNFSHEWRVWQGSSSRVWRPWLGVRLQLLRSRELQKGLIGLTRAQLAQRFGPPDRHWMCTHCDEIMLWDVGGSAAVNASVRADVCFQTSTWRNW